MVFGLGVRGGVRADPSGLRERAASLGPFDPETAPAATWFEETTRSLDKNTMELPARKPGEQPEPGGAPAGPGGSQSKEGSRPAPRTEGPIGPVLRGGKGSEEGTARRTVCLLTTLQPERGLSWALVQYLTQEMPGIRFTLAPAENVDAVWVCGFQPGSGPLVRRIRRRNPGALVVVTGRGRVESWQAEVLEAGADHACGWPVPYARLAGIFQTGRRVSSAS